MPVLQESFRSAQSQITTSQSLYDGLANQFQSSLSNLPLHFSLVDEALTSYRRVVDRIQGDFVLKSRVEELFISINQTVEERRTLSMEASSVIIMVTVCLYSIRTL